MTGPDILAWVGREKASVETLSPFPARALASLLGRADVPGDGDLLPPGWQWLYFLDTPTPERTGPDGHSLRGDFLPPVALQRRLWASGRFTIAGPLIIGEPAERVSRIASITPKTGDSGAMVFVEVEHRICQGGALRILEAQTLVYRAIPDGPAALQSPEPPPASTWVRPWPVDPVTLFRYSALTFNGHRIHYDRRYATTVEHYPGLVVQGPLLATLLLDLARRESPDARIETFSFRASAPTFDNDALSLHGNPVPGGVALWTHNGRGVGMTAQAKFRDGAVLPRETIHLAALPAATPRRRTICGDPASKGSDPMPQTLATSIETTPAPDILLELDTLLRRATRIVALACTVDGALDSDLLDRRQSDAYEIAFAVAELLAARATVEEAASGGPLARALMRTYRAEALQSVAQRLELISLGAPVLAADINALRSRAEFAALLRCGQGVEALDETGRLLLEGGEEIGHTALDEDKTLMRDAFLRFGDEVVRPHAEHIHRQDLTIPESLLEPMREMGVFGLSVPARFGGSAPDDGEDNLSMMVVTEALSEVSLAAGGSLITRPEIMTRALLAGGTPAQQARWLPALAAGAPLCAIAITEPDFGSDVASLSLKGTRVAGGWTLNGAKTWCTFAGKAGLLMVVVRTEADRSLGHRGLSIMLVEKPSCDGHAFDYRQEAGGRLRGKAIPTIGYRGMHSFDLAFEDVFVPDADVLGEENGLGKGFYFTMAGMTGGRMQTAARACGVMRAALTATLAYASDRKVFGAPLGSYQLTRAKLARMAARFAASRQLAYSIGRRLDRGESQMEASLAKLFACRSAEIVTREALQVHGGMGYAEESPVSRYFVDARVLSIFEGAEETLALKVVARSLLQAALCEHPA